MHIAIEGVDGVGKTTAAKTVACKLGFTLVEKPLHYLFDDENSVTNYTRIRDYFNNQPDRFMSAWFYGLGNIYIYEKFKGRNIVTDRHLLSNYFWSGKEESEIIFKVLVERIGTPDWTFILSANKKTVLDRLNSRDLYDKDKKKLDKIPIAYEKMENFCKKYKMPYTVIDTNSLSAEQVTNKIIDKLKLEGVLK